ncbi:MAG: hypothetical protein M1308_00455 [Actinobacteria bacterium]|nr:hypothetical protein [Actinomycetota bacterium]
MLVVFAAFKNEADGLLKLMNCKKIIKNFNSVVYTGEIFNRGIVVAITGIGRLNAAICVNNIIMLNLSNPVFLIQGISGALIENLRIGDLAIYETVKNLEKIPGGKHIKLNSLNDVADMQVDIKNNDIFNMEILKIRGGTVPSVVTSYEDKIALNKTCGVEVIDMESFYIADAAIRKGIPVICIRSISDNLTESISRFFIEFNHNGIFKKFLFLLKMLFSRSKTKSVLRTIKNINLANKSLNDFIIKTVLPFSGYIQR